MFFKETLEQFPVVFMETKLGVITGESSAHLQPCCGRFSVTQVMEWSALKISRHVSVNRKAGILSQFFFLYFVFFVPKTNLNIQHTSYN